MKVRDESPSVESPRGSERAKAIRAEFASVEREVLRIWVELESDRVAHLGAFTSRVRLPVHLLSSRGAHRRIKRLQDRLETHRQATRHLEQLRAESLVFARLQAGAMDEVPDGLRAGDETVSKFIDRVARHADANVWRLALELEMLERRPVARWPHRGGVRRDFRRDARGSAGTSKGRRHSDLILFRRMFAQARPQWRSLAGICALWLLATPLALLAPVPLQVAVDNVIGKHPLPGYLGWTLPGGLANSHLALLMLATVLMALIVVLTEAVWLAAWVAGEYTGERLTLRFRSDLFAHAQRLSLIYHDKRGTADSAYRIELDAPALRYLLVDGLIPFVASAVTVGSMLYVTFRLDWQLGLVALAISPILFYLVQGSRSRLRHQAHKSKQLESSALGVVQEVLSTLRVVKAFGQEPREYERFVRTSRDSTNARIRQALTAGLYGVAATCVIGLGSAAVLYVGIRHVEARTLTLGSLILVIGYMTLLYAPLKTMSRQVGGLQTHLASADRAFALLDENLEIRERQDALRLTRAQGRVSFRGVSFAYDAVNPVLEDICFDIPAGSRVGISGPTGAGKTTIFNLLMRLYDPTVGQILLDEHDIREYRLGDLRRQFAIVLQDPVLFSTTIRENISYGRPDAPMEGVIAAARAANAHEFIEGLPAGYETMVSERGVSLSGGQRQRISLARAFLKDAPILLLDEPTSSVDRNTEGSILRALDRLMDGRTTLLITHHSSALEVCDQHVELRTGRLIDESANTPRSAVAR